MPLNLNGANIPASHNIIYSGTALDRVNFNSTTVWRHTPDYLYRAGDLCEEWTGGWAQAPVYMGHANYWNGTAGAAAGTNGRLTIDAAALRSETANGQYCGVGAQTVRTVDLTAISSLTARFSRARGGAQFCYASLGVTRSIENKYQPLSATGAVYKQIDILANGDYAITLDTRALTGAYFVMFNTVTSNGDNVITMLREISVA